MKKIYTILLTAAIIILIAWFFLINGEDIAENEIVEEVNPYKDANLIAEIIPAPNDTYGYNIKMNGRLLIHQPGAPALPGVEGFKSEEDAMKVAEFVISRIRQNIFPPSVTVAELDSLGVL